MNCPKCGDDTRVTDSRPTSEGTIKRYRRCLSSKCCYSFKTQEVCELLTDVYLMKNKSGARILYPDDVKFTKNNAAGFTIPKDGEYC